MIISVNMITARQNDGHAPGRLDGGGIRGGALTSPTSLAEAMIPIIGVDNIWYLVCLDELPKIGDQTVFYLVLILLVAGKPLGEDLFFIQNT